MSAYNAMKKILLLAAACAGILTAAAAVFRRSFLNTGKKHFGSPTKKEYIKWLRDTGYEEHYIASRDGYFLHGIAIKNTSDNWVLLVHGYDSDRNGMLGYAQLFYNRGFSVFIPDQRGYGLSGSNETTMGHREKLDMADWARKITDDFGAENIVFLGVSMGGATVMLASAEELPETVRAIIDDCGYSSVREEFEYNMKRLYRIPPYPLLWFCDILTRIRSGWSILKDADCVKAVSRTKLPVLFIHGSADVFVPFYMQEKLYDACCSPDKEKLVVYGAEHTEAYPVEPELYEKTVFEFIEKHIAVKESTVV